MKQTIIKCDICGKEGGVRSMHLPVFRTFDETDAKYLEEIIDTITHL